MSYNTRQICCSFFFPPPFLSAILALLRISTRLPPKTRPDCLADTLFSFAEDHFSAFSLCFFPVRSTELRELSVTFLTVKVPCCKVLCVSFLSLLFQIISCHDHSRPHTQPLFFSSASFPLSPRRRPLSRTFPSADTHPPPVVEIFPFLLRNRPPILRLVEVKEILDKVFRDLCRVLLQALLVFSRSPFARK